MPPGQVSRGQGGTGLRYLTRSLSLWKKDKSHDLGDNFNSKSSSNDNSGSNANGSGSSSSGTRPNGSSSGSSSGSSGTSSTNSPPLPPCFYPCVSDNDPGVSYSASWSLSPLSFFQTSHQTDVVGSSLSFNFTGTGITVFGSVPPSNATHGPPTAAYSIDGGQPVATAEAMASTTIPNQPLFSTSGLSAGLHSLVINVTDVQSASPFSIDYFIVKPVPSHTPSPSASVITPEHVVTSSTASASANRSAATVGILAGVLGAVIFILLCVVTFFLVILRRRRQRALRSKSMQGSLFTSPESILMYSREPSSYYASRNPWRNKQPSLSEKSQKTMTSYGLNTHGQ